MDAVITNASAEAKFIPGPNINIPAGESKTWSGITVADIDGNEVIKAGVVAGDLTVSMTSGTGDAAIATQGSLVFGSLPIYTFANLPTGFNGRVAFVSDGRKAAEGVGAGTGVPAYYDAAAAAWLNFYDNLATVV